MYRWLNKKEKGKKIISFIPQLFGFTAKMGGYKIKDYVSSAEILARSQLEASRKLNTDAVFNFTDNSIEAEALGARLTFPEDDYPYVIKHVDINDQYLNKLELEKQLDAKRLQESFKAVQLLKENSPDNLLVIGKISGPLTIAAQLIGLEKLIFLLLDEPEKASKLLDLMTEFALMIGKRLLTKGSDVIMIFDPAASPRVLNTSLFKTYGLPWLSFLVSHLKKQSSPLIWCNIINPNSEYLGLIKELKVDWISIGYDFAVEQAVSLLQDKMIIGNVKPASFIKDNSQEVEYATTKLSKFAQNYQNLIISSGCEIPINARWENIRKMAKIIRRDSINERE